ncbi:MAG: hypothetical protein JXQ83_13750, partial [Candidatus Glassbacteria bacterium]|nr:hypothetical protein [Candidatus Glassbacteria bacterium]
GILRIRDGVAAMLCQPYSGQGVGLDIHDLRGLRMTRRGDLITVYTDGRMIFQAADTSAGTVRSGQAVVCSRGPVGLAIAGLSLSPLVPPALKWKGPGRMKSFHFALDEGGGHQISDDTRKYQGTVELGVSGKRNLMGWWVSDSGSEMGRSYTAAGGQLTIQSYAMGPQASLECRFKLLEPVPAEGVPIIQLVFDGSRLNPAWGRERGGPMAMPSADGTIGLHFHEFGDVSADFPDVFTTGEWTHLAWIRDRARHIIYVNGEVAGVMDIPKYGDTELTGIQINMGQNADHDWLAGLGSAYLYIDDLRASGQALDRKQVREHMAL